MSEDLTRPENIEDLAGKPKKLYRLAKADLLTPEELDRCQELGFGCEMDPEDDLHVEMYGTVKLSKERLAQKAIQIRDAEDETRREYARIYLRNNHPEVQVELLPDNVLDEIGTAVDRASTAEAGEDVFIVEQDDDNLCLVTESGEVVGFINAPNDDLERRNILEWLGERLTTSQAKQAGLAAEKDYWVKKINKQYDPQINRQARIQDRLTYLYTPLAQAYLDEIVAAHKGKTPLNSVKVGLLMLQYRATVSRVDVLDEERAIPWMEKNCPLAIKIKKEIGKSLIPDEIKKILTDEQKAESGIYYYPGGEKKFSIK